MHIEKPLFPLNTKFFHTVFFEMKMFYGYVIFNYTVLYYVVNMAVLGHFCACSILLQWSSVHKSVEGRSLGLFFQEMEARLKP